MTLKIYNDLSRKKEEFKPLNDPKVGIYVCGPTIYDYAHLGHAMSAIVFDLIRRYLIYKNYDVTYVFNYTDIDDKLINRAKEENTTVKELAEKFTKIYNEDYSTLKVLKPDFNPKATEYIPTMIKIIKSLEEKGITYIIEGDGVYYDIKKFPEYGKLSHQNIEDLQAGARIDVDDKKHNPQDFVLWKFEKPGEPSWESPWGKGRPGWHIECSAMSLKLIGKTLDIHGGGRDLIFPHHEDEIAQSEAANNAPFAKYWMHNGFVQTNNEKMSKSLGNFFTIRDALKNIEPLTIRYLFVSNHYRSPLNFSMESLESAKNSREKIQTFYDELEQGENNINISDYKQQFEEALDDDFNVSKALAVIFDLMKECHKSPPKNIDQIKAFMDDFNSIFAILETQETEIPENIQQIINKRKEARNNKDWERSDKLRKKLKELGYEVKDKDGKQKIKKI